MRIVLVRLSALGDIVHTWPLAEALRSARPDAHLSWVVRALLPGGRPPCRQRGLKWIPGARRHSVGARPGANRDARTRFHSSPDLALDPQGVVKSALLTWWTGAPQRIGLATPWRRERLAGLGYTATLPGSRDRRHVVASNLELVRAVGATPPAELPHPDGRWLLDRIADRPCPVPPQPPFVALLPGAGRAHKLLPVEGLAEVARRATAAGWAVQVLWGPGEEERASEVVARAGGAVWHRPPTSGSGQGCGARAVVGGDTGRSISRRASAFRWRSSPPCLAAANWGARQSSRHLDGAFARGARPRTGAGDARADGRRHRTAVGV
jgi:ADP-heptose:LPS heptosyltransferase